MNPFSLIDNRSKPLFRFKNQQYFLRIITKEETLRRNPPVIDLLGRLATESEIDLAREIAPRKELLKKLHRPEQLWQPTEDWLSSSFDTSANRTVFVIEDSKQRPISCAIMLMNSAEDRKKMKVDPRVGTFVYVTHAVTQEAWKGKGLFSLILNKAMSMTANPKRSMPLPIDFSISVSAATAIRQDGSEVNYVMNLPRYAKMWENRFENNKLQIRLQNFRNTIQEGTNRHCLDRFLSKNGLDEESISNLIEENKEEAAKQGKWVRGIYLEGRQKMTYTESVIKRKQESTVIISRL